VPVLPTNALPAGPDIALILAIAISAAVAASLFARYLRFLPLVTAYILVGIAIGPHALKLLNVEQVERLGPLRDLALAVILFTIGTRFDLAAFRKLLPWLTRWGLWDIALMGIVVTVSMAGLIGGWHLAVLMAVIAMEIAPAATFLVLRETASAGMLTRLVLNAVVVNNIVVIALFALAWPTVEVLDDIMVAGNELHIGRDNPQAGHSGDCTVQLGRGGGKMQPEKCFGHWEMPAFFCRSLTPDPRYLMPHPHSPRHPAHAARFNKRSPL
jgi:hypothetical protein